MGIKMRRDELTQEERAGRSKWRKGRSWIHGGILGGVVGLVLVWSGGWVGGAGFAGEEARLPLSSTLQAGEEEVEPNETVEQATPIPIPGALSGRVKFGDAAQVQYRYQNGPVDLIEDLFRFRVAAGGSVQVDVALQYDNGAVDVDLFLFRLESSGELTALGVSNGSSTTERILPLPTLAPGEYLVGVSAFDEPANQGEARYRLSVAVGGGAPAPGIASLAPTSIEAGGGPFSLLVRGESFVEGMSVVRWNGHPRPTTYLGPGELIGYLSAADIAAVGTAFVTVENPGTGGGISAPVPFSVVAVGVPLMEVEPNDLPQQANLLMVPGKRSGQVGVTDPGGVTISLGGGLVDKIEDLFAVTLMRESRLSLTLTAEDPSAGLVLYLLGEGATSQEVTVLGSSRRVGGRQEITTPLALPSGRYLVGVSAVDGTSRYTLEAVVPGPRLLQVETASAAPDSRVSLPLTFFAEGDEGRMIFSLAFDPSVLGNPQWESAASQAGIEARLETSLLAQGRLGVELRLPVGQFLSAGPQGLGWVHFQIQPGQTRQTTAVEFVDQPLVRSLYTRDLRAVLGHYSSGMAIIIPGVEGDVAPRPFGNGTASVSIADWTQVGRFASNLDRPIDGSEFQRADTAPKSTRGDGRLTIADWVQVGRYAAGIEAILPAGGPTGPAGTVTVIDASQPFSKVWSDESGLQRVLQGEPNRTLRVVETRFERDRENELSIELLAEGNENALGFSVTFDVTQLTFVRATLGRDVSGAVLNVNPTRLAEGRLGLALALPSGQALAAGPRQIIRLIFTVPATNSVNTTTISFGDLPIAREVVDAEASTLSTLYRAGEVRFDPGIEQLPVLSGLAPDRLLVGQSEAVVRVEGRNFQVGAIARVGGQSRTTRYLDATVLVVELDGIDLQEAGTLEVTVQNPSPGGGLSNALPLVIENSLPILSRLVPEVVGISTVGLTLTLEGERFVRGSLGEVDGISRPTTYVSPTRMTLQFQPGDLARAGSLRIRVVAPPPGGGASQERTLSVRPLNPLPRITQLSPNMVEALEEDFTLTVTGTNFVEDSAVTINGVRLPTTFRSANELGAEVDRQWIQRTGTALIGVSNPTPGGGNSNTLLLTITEPRNPIPVVVEVIPGRVLAGSPRLTLTVRGSNFVTSSVVQVNGLAQATTYRQRTELGVEIPAELLIAADDLSIRVVNPAPGGGASESIPLMIVNPVPVLVSLSPSVVVEGSGALTLTLVGSGLTPDSRVWIDGTARATSYQSATRITTQLTATDLATVRTLSVEVRSPSPGGGVSNRLTLEVRKPNPLPRIQAIRPGEVAVGTGSIFLVVEGTRFVTDSVIQIDRQPRRTEFVSESVLVTEIEAEELEQPGERVVTVQNPSPGGGDSNSVLLQVLYPTPRLTSITPNSVVAGSPTTEVVIFGEGFASRSVLQMAGTPLTVTRVSSSQLVGSIPASRLTNGGTFALEVVNPSPGGGSSNALFLTVRNPVPSVTRFRTVGLEANAETFQVVLDGTGFVPGSVVEVQGQGRPTSWQSDRQLTAVLPVRDLERDGTLTLAVFNPAPGGGTSSQIVQQVGAPSPATTRLIPDRALVGGAPFVLTIEGRDFLPTSVVHWDGGARPTTYRSPTQLEIAVSSMDLQQAGTVSLTVRTAGPGGGNSNPVILTILNPAPTLSAITPSIGYVGGETIAIRVDGTGFVSTTKVLWNGVALATTFVSSTRLQAQVAASELLVEGRALLTVQSPAPGGGISSVLEFRIEPPPNPVPIIASLSPSSALEGELPGTIEIRGTGFVPGVSLIWEGRSRAVTYLAPDRLVVRLEAEDLATPGQFSLLVINPTPGGGASNLVRWIVDPKPINCQTTCLQSPDYHLNNLSSLPSGSIWIGRFLYNIRYNRLTVQRSLEGNKTLLEQLTRHFSAAQLSVATGGNTPGILNSALSCYAVRFDPILLSTGEGITRQTSISDLFHATRGAVISGTEEDQQALLTLLVALNGNNPHSRCR
jgi:hypothetical protein